MLIGYSLPVDYYGRLARLPLWRTWYRLKSRDDALTYVGPSRADVAARSFKAKLDVSTKPRELVGTTERAWSLQATRLWIAHFGPPTWFRMGDNGCWISEHLVSHPEPVPTVYMNVG